MPDEEKKELPQGKPEGDNLYDRLAEFHPEREVEVELGGESGLVIPKGVTKAVTGQANLTNVQSALKSLFPEELGDAITNKLMISNIYPDMARPMTDMLTINEIEMTDREENIDVLKIYTKYAILTSIGLDGRGRIDQMEIVGADNDKETLSKSMGMG